MAEVVSDSEPSPLEALRTGLNMVAALAVSVSTSGTGIPPVKQGNVELFYYYQRHCDMPAFTLRLLHLQSHTHTHGQLNTHTHTHIRRQSHSEVTAKYKITDKQMD